MNLFQTVKEGLTTRQVAQQYGLEVGRNGMACCPFHPDRNPSMKLNDRYYHCFGCGAHGDVIDLAAGLLGQKSYQAAKRLAQDFGFSVEADWLPPPIRPKPKPNPREITRRCTAQLTHYLVLFRRWGDDYSPACGGAVDDPRFVMASHYQDYLAYLLDCLDADPEAMTQDILGSQVLEALAQAVAPYVGEEEGHG